MNLLKKSVSVVLSILMVSNFTVSHVFGKTEKMSNKEEEPSLVSYVIAGAVGAVAGTALALGGIYLLGDNNNHYKRCQGPINIKNIPPHIKAIHWDKNYCWWISSVLFLYYWTDFKKFLCREDIVNLVNNIADSQIDAERERKEIAIVLKDVREIFNALDNCQGNVCYITDDSDKMNRYIENVASISIENNNINDGKYHFPFLLSLLAKMQSLGNGFENYNRITSQNARYNNEYKVVLMAWSENGGHFYIYLDPDNANYDGFIIGGSTDDATSISKGRIRYAPPSDRSPYSIPA